MKDPIKAKHYKDQAEHLRGLASLDDNADTREALLSVARSYDRLHTKYSRDVFHGPQKPAS